MEHPAEHNPGRVVPAQRCHNIRPDPDIPTVSRFTSDPTGPILIEENGPAPLATARAWPHSLEECDVNKRTTAAAIMLGALLLGACGSGGADGLRASADQGDSAPLVEAAAEETTTSTTEVVEAAASTTSTTAAKKAPSGTVTSTTVQSGTTSASEQAAAEAARQAKESADQAAQSAQRAEEAAHAATSTTTTTMAPTTTTTTVPVYAWVKVATITEGTAPITLTGGELRAHDPYGALKPRTLGPGGKLWVDDGSGLVDGAACVAGPGAADDCVWSRTWPAGNYTLHIDGGASYKPVTVEEWRVIG